MNYQKLIIAGNATRDTELKKSKSGEVTYASLRVAVKDRKGESVFFPITVFGKQAEKVAEYVKKGRGVLIEGRIEVSQNGRMGVVADRVIFGAPATTRYEKAKKTAEKLVKESESTADKES